MLCSPQGRLQSAADINFLKNIVQMAFYGMGADVKRLGNLTVGSPLGNFLQYLLFPGG